MRVFVAGHRGLVGSAVVRKLKRETSDEIVTRTRQELDLLNQSAVEEFFKHESIDQVYIAAARVGGIHANRTFPVEFLYENLMIACNVIHLAFKHKTDKVLFLGSSCIYPKLAPQPMTESALLTSSLEPTNEAYALAKISGLKLCEFYNKQYGKRAISAMPTNMYGPNDNFHPEHSHVIPGMMRKFYDAKKANAPSVKLWGSGNPKREFLHADDLADALVFLMDKYEGAETVNVGTGRDCKISELAEMIKDVSGYAGEIEYDTSMPDGPPRKLLDISKIKGVGWEPKINLKDGLKSSYDWAIENRVFD